MNTINKTISSVILKSFLILSGIILPLSLILTGCGEDFLYKEPKGVVFTENLANNEGISGYVAGGKNSELFDISFNT